MFKRILLLAFVALGLFTLNARAELKVDIIAGTTEPISVAVQKIEVASGAAASDAAIVRTVVEENLKRTGLFHIVNHNA